LCGRRVVVADDMFFSADGKTLKKGRRVTKRTPVKRLAEFWRADDKGGLYRGLIRDLNPYGLLLECNRGLPVDTVIQVELKRDGSFADPLSAVNGRIVRVVDTGRGTWQMGVQLILARPEPASKPIRIEPRKSTLPERKPTRMYSLDTMLGTEE
jgi:hypothetical protein